MFFRKNRIIIGLTTFDTEFLRISVPAITRLKTPTLLIIHNDNPDIKIKWWHIRKLGYFGPFRIINNDKNEGILKSRLNIINKIKELNVPYKWVMFADDSDIIKDIKTPHLKSDTFAVIQNTMIVKHSLINVLRLLDNTGCIIDNQDSILKSPNMEIRGTLLNRKILIDFADVIENVIPQITQLESRLTYLPHYNDIMWSYLQMYVEKFMPNVKPIYMNRISYIIIDLDSTRKKYGKSVEPSNNKDFEKDMIEYYNIFNEFLNQIKKDIKEDKNDDDL